MFVSIFNIKPLILYEVFFKRMIICYIFQLSLGMSSIVAQNDEATMVSIVYQFTHTYDTTDRGNPIVAEMLLQVGKTNSKYTNVLFNDEYRHSSNAMTSVSTATNAVGSPSVMRFSGMPIAIVYDKSITPGAIYQSFQRKKIFRIQKIGVKDYLIEDSLPAIDWKVESDTREIASYTCQKAIGVYAGRTYTVWFTVELPYPYGPWKLSGLPGLILEAKDETGEVQFLFKEKRIERSEMAAFTFTRPSRTTNEQFEKAEREFKRDPVGIVAAQVQFSLPPGSTPFFKSASGKILSGDAAKEAIKLENSIRHNNSIERF